MTKTIDIKKRLLKIGESLKIGDVFYDGSVWEKELAEFQPIAIRHAGERIYRPIKPKPTNAKSGKKPTNLFNAWMKINPKTGQLLKDDIAYSYRMNDKLVPVTITLSKTKEKP